MQHTFKGQHITVIYDDETCTHAANCVRSLPAVFDAERTPWIDPSGASAKNIVAVVRACPSGALRYELD